MNSFRGSGSTSFYIYFPPFPISLSSPAFSASQISKSPTPSPSFSLFSIEMELNRSVFIPANSAFSTKALFAAPANRFQSDIELAKKNVTAGRLSFRIPISREAWAAYKTSVFPRSPSSPPQVEAAAALAEAAAALADGEISTTTISDRFTAAASALAKAAEALGAAVHGEEGRPLSLEEEPPVEPPVFKAIEGGAIEIIAYPTVLALFASLHAAAGVVRPNFTTPMAGSSFFGTLVRDREIANDINLLLGRSWGGRFSEKMNRGTRAGVDKAQIPSVRRVVTGGADVLLEEEKIFRADIPMGTVENTRRFWWNAFSVVFVPTGALENDVTADLPFPKKEKVEGEDAPVAKVEPPKDGTMLVFLPVVRFEDEVEFERIRAILANADLSFIGGI